MRWWIWYAAKPKVANFKCFRGINCKNVRSVQHPLPLPLGEVAERSEDGEGVCNLQSTAKPSQSPSVTALPKGEPRAGCRACRTRFSRQHIKARTAGFRAVSPSNCTKNQKITCFRALSPCSTHPNPHNPAGAATAAKSPQHPHQTAQLSC